jgi:hypothetical protein
MDAYASAKRAYDSAVAADKSAEEASAAYVAALTAAKQLAADNIARWANEQSYHCQEPGVDTQTCLNNVYKIVENPARVAFLNSGVCEFFYLQGSELYNACLKDVLNPDFQQSQELLTIVLPFIAGFFEAVSNALLIGAGVVIGAAVAACAICGALLEFFTPLLAPELVGLSLPSAGAYALAGAAVSIRVGAMLERLAVEATAETAPLYRLVFGLAELSVQSRNPLGVMRGGTWDGNVYGDVVIYGGTIHGDVHGNVIMWHGGTIIGDVYGNVVQIGTHNVVGSLGPAGANSIVGSVNGNLVQAANMSGVIAW